MSEKRNAIIIILIAIGSLQYGSSLAKGLFPALGAPGAAANRLILASFMMIMIWKPWKEKITQKTLHAVLLYGASLGLMNLLFYLSLERIPLGIAVALEFTGPLSIALLHSRKPIDFVWATLAALGIVLLLPIEKTAQTLDFVGMMLALGAGACWAGYIHFGKKAVENQAEGVISSLGMTVAALIVLPLAFFLSEKTIFQFDIIPLAILVALLSSALPYTLEMFALKKLPAKTFGILMSLEPAWATLMGFLFLKESLQLSELVAIFCIMLASLGGTLGIKQNS